MNGPPATQDKRASQANAAESLSLEVKLLPLTDTDPLRDRQLAVIVKLLRRAAAEAEHSGPPRA
jgi:hypothetical protein